MADPVLHIKDSYYFEIPKVLWPSNRSRVQDFPDVWVTLDPDFQDWEFSRLYDALMKSGVALPPRDRAQHDWHSWVRADHANVGKPFDEFLESQFSQHWAGYKSWQAKQIADAQASSNAEAVVGAKSQQIEDYLGTVPLKNQEYSSFSARRADALWTKSTWRNIKSNAGDVRTYAADLDQSVAGIAPWSSEKIAAYNSQLSGKIVIPQPFGGQLRNLYQPDSGFCVSKFMIIELAVALIMCVVFSWLGSRTRPGGSPRGKLWNLLETFVVYIRDEVAEPAIGHHDAGKFVPLLCTLFFFILGCNLFGMVPWLGAPTAAFGVTFGLAFITFGTGIACGMKQLGGLGYFLNLIPPVELGAPSNPLMRLIVGLFEFILKFGIFLIEVLGLCIKHLVLSIRLLANMVAGHLVLLGVMGLAFGAHAALEFTAPNVPGWQWPLTATIAVVGSTLFSLLELLVALLQAYIFTFLSALFIGAAIHHH